LSEKDVYKELLINKSKSAKAFVEKARSILGIDEETGEPIILIPRKKLTDKLLISIYLCGKFFASELGLIDSPSASIGELNEKLGIEKDVISARVSELKNEGKIKILERGKYEVIFNSIGMILDEIHEKVGE